MAPLASILVVEDEQSMRQFLEILLRRNRYDVTVAANGKEAFSALEQREVDVVITDLKMPDVDGIQVLRGTKERYPATEVVMITAFATAETAIEAMKAGAYDYLTKPFKVDEVLVTLERAVEKRRLVRDNAALREQLSGRFRLEGMIGRSGPMQRLFELVRRVARTKTSILITGESGTGKELIARAIHDLSDRAQAPFIPINCGAIPETLIESELFGHVRGAFTGAATDKDGLFTAADGGTIFLDEIGELSLGMQVKLLRALQERMIKPVGGVEERTVDVRILAATNRDMEEAVRSGKFRSDLYYRLNVIPLQLPPLRERSADIPLLVEHFLRKYSAALGRNISSVGAQAMARLCAYPFPGNVRELENLIERAVTLSADDEIDATVISSIGPNPSLGTNGDLMTLPDQGLDLDAHMGGIERRLLQQAMDRTEGNRTEAARLLSVSVRSLRYRLLKYGIATDGDLT